MIIISFILQISEIVAQTQTIYQFKGEKRILENQNLIYENSSFIHSTNPFELKQTLNLTYPIIEFATFQGHSLFLLKKDKKLFRFHIDTLQTNLDFKFNCEEFQILPYPNPLLFILLCKTDSFEYVVYDPSFNIIVFKSMLNLNYSSPIIEWNFHSLVLGDKIGTNQWKLTLFQFKELQLIKIKEINYIDFKLKVIQFQIDQESEPNLYLLSPLFIYKIEKVFNDESELIFQIIQFVKHTCEYHKMLITSEMYFIYKCEDQFYGKYKIANQINKDTQIVQINNQFLLLNKNQLYFEDQSIPVFNILENCKLFIENEYFYYLSDNKVQQYYVNNPIKYIYSNQDLQQVEIINIAQETTYNKFQFRQLIIYYFPNQSIYFDMYQNNITNIMSIQNVHNSSDITFNFNIEIIGFSFKFISPELSREYDNFQCIEDNRYLTYIRLIKYINTQEMKFENIKYQSIWLIELNHTLQFAVCQIQEITQYFEINNNYTNLYINEICQFQDLFTFRIDQIIYALNLQENIKISTHLKYYRISNLSTINLCSSNNININYTHYLQSFNNIIQLCPNNDLNTLQFNQDPIIKQLLDQIQLTKIIHLMLITTPQYSRLLLFYQDKIDNYLLIKNQIIFCYSFILNTLNLYIPSTLKYSFINEKIGIIVKDINKQKQQYLLILNFDASFLQCFHDIFEIDSDIFILQDQYISIQKNKLIYIRQPQKLIFRLNEQIDFQKQFSQKIMLTYNLTYWYNKYQTNNQINILLINNPYLISKNVNEKYVQLLNKHYSFILNIQELFYGSVSQVQINEQYQLSTPLSYYQTIKFKFYFNDICFNQQILILINNQVFAIDQSYTLQFVQQTNLILVIQINVDQQCIQLYQFNSLIILICVENHSRYYLHYYNEYSYVTGFSFQWNPSQRIKIQYEDDIIILCPKNKIQKRDSIDQVCKIFQIINQISIVEIESTQFEVVYFKHQFIKYNLTLFSCEFQFNNQQLEFDILTLIQQDLGFSLDFPYYQIQLYQTKQNIYLIIQPIYSFIIVMKLLNQNLQVLYYLDLFDKTKNHKIIKLVEDEFCILQSQDKHNNIILSYYQLNNKNTKQKFMINQIILDQYCENETFLFESIYQMKNQYNSTEYYYLCTGPAVTQTNSYLPQTQIIKIQQFYQIEMGSNYPKKSLLLKVNNSLDSQEITITFDKQNSKYNIIIISFLIIQILLINRLQIQSNRVQTYKNIIT